LSFYGRPIEYDRPLYCCPAVSSFLWSPYGIRQTIIFSSCRFFFFLLFFFPRSNISSRSLHSMVNLGLLAAEISPVVWGTPANCNRFRVLGALLHGSSGRQPNCSVEQRAPSVFGRAAITLGIGPHSSCLSVCLSVTLLNVRVCAPDFAMKALEYRNDFNVVGYGRL